jgi:hypothetical protein
MFDAACEVYNNYLVEYRIDSALFLSPTIKTLPNEDRSYKWIAKSAGSIAGIEVIVTKTRGTKPEMILIGGMDAWRPLLSGSILR